MDIESRLALIRQVGEEIVTEQELRELLETKAHPVAYDGFEPSGLAHLPFGVFRPLLLKDMLKSGVKFKILLADYFAWINKKMGGDLDVIHKVGEYFIEVWKAAGVDPDKVDFVWASDIMDREYWKKVILIAKATTVARATRALNIMGRKEGELKEVAQYFYPMMQAADPVQLGVDINQLGLDQRRAGMLSREAAEHYKWKKPVIISHHMLMGLEGDKKPDLPKDKLFAVENLLKDFVVSSKNLLEIFKALEPKHIASDAKVIGLKNNEWISEYKYEVDKMYKESILIATKFSENPRFYGFFEKNMPPVTKDVNKLVSKIGRYLSSSFVKMPLEERTALGREIMRIRNRIVVELDNEFNEERVSLNESYDSKMSKSKSLSSIFMHDTGEQIKAKLNTAYCPAKVIENNPILDYSKHIIFRAFKTMEIERPQKFGGPISFSSYNELESAFREGNLHPMDLKNGVADGLDKLIEPVRLHFEKNAKAKKLYDFVKSQNITR